jgi:hypothetical protein
LEECFLQHHFSYVLCSIASTPLLQHHLLQHCFNTAFATLSFVATLQHFNIAFVAPSFAASFLLLNGGEV